MSEIRVREKTCYLCGKPSWGRACRSCYSKKKHTGVTKFKPSVIYKKKCLKCGNVFYTYSKQMIYCSLKCRVKYYNESPSGKKAKEKWRKKNPDKIRAIAKRHREKVKRESEITST